MKWRIKERAESGRAGCKTKERPCARSGQGTRQTMERLRSPEQGRRSRKSIFLPRYYTKKRLGRKGFPGYFLFYRYEKFCP